MQICEEHWKVCRQAIVDRGLYNMVSKDDEQLMARMQAQAEGDMSPENFDPLQALGLMLMGNAVKILGMRALMPNEDGTPMCPCCEARKDFNMHHDSEDGKCGHEGCPVVVTKGSAPWDQAAIEGASDAILQYCRQAGTAPTLQ